MSRINVWEWSVTTERCSIKYVVVDGIYLSVLALPVVEFSNRKINAVCCRAGEWRLSMLLSLVSSFLSMSEKWWVKRSLKHAWQHATSMTHTTTALTSMAGWWLMGIAWEEMVSSMYMCSFNVARRVFNHLVVELNARFDVREPKIKWELNKEGFNWPLSIPHVWFVKDRTVWWVYRARG